MEQQDQCPHGPAYAARRRLKGGLLAHPDELHVRATLDAPLLRLGQRKGAAAGRVDAIVARDKIRVLRDIIVARPPSGRFVDADNVAGSIAFLCGPHGADINDAALPIDEAWLWMGRFGALCYTSQVKGGESRARIVC